MSVDWNIWYCSDGNTLPNGLTDSMKSLLKFKLLFFFFLQKWKMYLKTHTKLQGTQSSQDSLEKEEQSWKTHTTLFQNLLQNYSN